MKSGIVLLAACVVLVSLGCSGVAVKTHFEPESRPAKLATYDWLPESKMAGITESSNTMIRAAIERELAAMRIVRVSDDPDFHIAVHGDVQLRFDDLTDGYTIRRGSDTIEKKYDDYYAEGTLIIDMVGAGNNELFWRGTATRILEGGMTDVERQKLVDEAIGKVLQKFPPVEN